MERTLKELVDILDSGKMMIRQDMREVMWDLRTAAEELLAATQSYNTTVDCITSLWKQGAQEINTHSLDSLCDKQITIEKIIDKHKGE